MLVRRCLVVAAGVLVVVDVGVFVLFGDTDADTFGSLFSSRSQIAFSYEQQSSIITRNFFAISSCSFSSLRTTPVSMVVRP